MHRSLAAVTAALALGLAACSGTTDADVLASSPGDAAAATTPATVDATTTTVPDDGTIPPPGSPGNGEPVTIAFGGDVHYDGSLADALRTAPGTMMAGVADAVDGADLAVVNLETAVTDGGAPQSKAFAFQAPPAAFDALTAGGWDVISMANNHGLDFGEKGLAETLAAIDEKDAPVIGIGADEAAAYRPHLTVVRGQRVAVIAATQVIDSNLVAAWTATPTQGGIASAKRIDRLVEEVRAARREADTVVVFLHWGQEKEYCPTADQQELAQTLADAGADVIVGGHAHRVQSAGWLGEAYVGYGLGNLQFRAGSLEARESGILVVTVAGRRVEAAEWRPARLGTDYLPRLLTGVDAEAAVARWDERRACTGLSATPPGVAPAEGATSTTAVGAP